MNEGRTFLVRNADQRRRLSHWLDTVSVDDQHPIEVVVKRWKARRSAAQNARYWAILHQIAEHTGHTPDEIHEYCKAKFIGVNRYDVLNRVIEVPMSSTSLNTAQFSDYSTRVEEWAASEHGVMLNDGGWHGSGNVIEGESRRVEENQRRMLR